LRFAADPAQELYD